MKKEASQSVHFIDRKQDVIRDKDNNPIRSHRYFSTNNVMIKPNNKKGGTIYLPAFMRLKFKNFNDLDIGGLSALLNGEIILFIYYGDLFKVFGKDQESYIQNCLMKQVVLLFARDNAIKLTNNAEQNEDKQLDIKVSHNREKREVKFILKKIFTLYLDSDIFYTPFEIINGILQVTVQPVELMYPYNKKNPENWKIEFNLQNNWNIKEKVDYANWGTFGNYDLAEKRIGALYTNYRISEAAFFTKTVQQRIQYQKERKQKEQIEANSQDIIKNIKNKKRYPSHNDRLDQKHVSYSESEKTPLFVVKTEDKQSKVQSFHYAYFNIPLYKFPIPAIITIFTPLFFLDVLNFGILFQDHGLADRMASIAGLVLAFAALIPTIRSQIPPNPRITLIEVLVYLQTTPTILAIIQSINLSEIFQQDQTFEFDWVNSAYFWVAFGISVITFMIIFILIVLHYCKWYPEYNDVAGRNKLSFDRLRWRNTECNECFNEFFIQTKDNQQKPTAVILRQRKYTKQYKINKETANKIQKLLTKIQVGDEIARKWINNGKIN